MRYVCFVFLMAWIVAPGTAGAIEFLDRIEPAAVLPESAADKLPGLAPMHPEHFRVQISCSPITPGLRHARFHWASGLKEPDPTIPLRIDVTQFSQGFATGHYESIGPLGSDTRGALISGGLAGVTYRWRVLFHTASGWVPGPTRTYQLPVCPVDWAESDPDTESPEELRRRATLNDVFRVVETYR